MKKVFVLSAAILIAFSFAANAQKFGAKAGFTMAKMMYSKDAPEGQKLHMGFNAGVLGEMELGEMFAVRGDLTFIQLGKKVSNSTEAFGVTTTNKLNTNLNYIQLQVSPKVTFGPAYAFVGPYFGYAISAKNKGESTTKSALGEVTAKIDENLFEKKDGDEKKHPYNRMDVGANLGIGANFNGIFVEANVGMGFLNFYKGLDSTKEDDDRKNLFFGISVGYMLGN